MAFGAIDGTVGLVSKRRSSCNILLWKKLAIAMTRALIALEAFRAKLPTARETPVVIFLALPICLLPCRPPPGHCDSYLQRFMKRIIQNSIIMESKAGWLRFLRSIFMCGRHRANDSFRHIQNFKFRERDGSFIFSVRHHAIKVWYFGLNSELF